MLDIPKIPRGIAQKLGHYVYIYVDPTHETVFYVGKGWGTRAVVHLNVTEKREIQRHIRKIRAAGEQPRVDILAHGLPDADTALKIEAAAIDLVGVDKLANVVRGHGVKFGRRPIDDLVSHYAKPPAKIVELLSSSASTESTGTVCRRLSSTMPRAAPGSWERSARRSSLLLPCSRELSAKYTVCKHGCRVAPHSITVGAVDGCDATDAGSSSG
jgi:hypothetical protein